MSLELAIILPDNFWSWETALFLIGSIIYGSIPFAYIFTYLFRHKKLNQTGTGNIGIANAFGVGGLTAGFLTVAGEASKGILPIIVSNLYYNGSLITSLIFITVAITAYGNSFFLKGRGGQGGTILMWALLILSPYTLFLYIFITAIAYLIIRQRRFAGSLGYIFLPIIVLFIEQNLAFIIFSAFWAFYYIIRYKPQKSDYQYYKSKMKFLRYFAKTLRERASLILTLDNAKNINDIGLKAYSLKILKRSGANVPRAYICPFSVFEAYHNNNAELINDLRHSLNKILKSDASYSVRSSANLEDSQDHSFAGQFISFLNVKTVEDVLKAIINIWHSIKSEHVQSYLTRMGKKLDDIQMAVIIQEMVNSRFSGVVFTKNPVTGFDEIIVEAVSGLGDRLNNPIANLERWVYKWGYWLEKPENACISETIIKTIISEARKISIKYGCAVDLEWAYDGDRIYWLQLRPITSLRGVNIYSNKISKEFLPGMIKPLVWSINIPVVNSSWKKLLIELFGRDAEHIKIESLAKSIYYRAYFNMGIMGDMFELLGMPRELLEVLLGLELEKENGPRYRPGLSSIKYLPRVILLSLKLLTFKKKIQQFLIYHDVLFHDIAAELEGLKIEDEILVSVNNLIKVTTNASYFVIVTILLMSINNKLLKYLANRYKIDPDKLDFSESRAKLSDIEPNYYLQELNTLYRSLPENDKERFRRNDIIHESDSATLKKIHDKMAAFLQKFGHLSDSGNDFSKQQWKEMPELTKEMIIDFTDKYETNESNGFYRVNYNLPRNPLFRYVYRNALAYREYKERVNYIYTYGYSLFRQHFLTIGSLWQGKNYITDKEDIFYLTHNEIKECQNHRLDFEMIKERIKKRKSDMQRMQNLRIPSIIIGDSLPPEIQEIEVSKILYGIPASKGYCRGKIVKIPTIEDFSKMHTGEILVIPHSDISWTPLFVSAKGIISESGGMLSHCSIIAREYGIPAVVSVPEAMKLQDGTVVILDGDKGEVIFRD